MEYRVMAIDEAERINEIDAEWYVKNAWRYVDAKRILVEIDWIGYELPNGLLWHLEHFKNTVKSGGVAIGCFDKGKLVGYGTLNAETFGKDGKYVLLDQLYVSKEYRNHGIGRNIIGLFGDKAKEQGADKIYVCAASAEDTIAFYRKMGFKDAMEINMELLQEDPNDLHMELAVSAI